MRCQCDDSQKRRSKKEVWDARGHRLWAQGWSRSADRTTQANAALCSIMNSERIFTLQFAAPSTAYAFCRARVLGRDLRCNGTIYYSLCIGSCSYASLGQSHFDRTDVAASTFWARQESEAAGEGFPATLPLHHSSYAASLVVLGGWAVLLVKVHSFESSRYLLPVSIGCNLSGDSS